MVISFIGGYLFYLGHVPIPWMLGPLVFVNIAASLFKIKVHWPVQVRNTGLVVLGYIMGSSFTMETLHQIIGQLPAMMAATLSTTLFCLLIGYITHKKTGIGLTSCVLGSTPGGMTQMVILSEEMPDSDTTIVTFMQTIRLLSTVFIVPFLAMHGLQHSTAHAAPAAAMLTHHPYAAPVFAAAAIVSGLAAYRLKFPTPFLLGPVLGTAAFVLAGLQPPTVPPLIVIAAQLFVGIYMGVTTKPSNLENWRQLLPYSIAGGLGIVLFTLGFGYILNYWHNIDVITAFLSTAPGGMTEMGITAINVGADISIITAYQLFRLLFMLLILPAALKWWLRPRPVTDAHRNA